jgi:hypothetical protein
MMERDVAASFDPWALTRRPYPDEAKAVGREPKPGKPVDYDLVLMFHNDPKDATRQNVLAMIAHAFEHLGCCDAAHVLPGVGIYLEE